MAHRFVRGARLLKPGEFDAAFASGVRVTEKCFSAVACSNSLQHPRLGLAISKKAVPLSVGRNRVKRQVRESFRKQLRELPAADIVISARPSANQASLSDMRAALAGVWLKIARVLPAAGP